MYTLETLQQKIEKAKDLDFGTIFNESIELFKKVWVQGLLIVLLTYIMILPFYFLMYIPLIATGVFDATSFENNGDPDLTMLIPFYGIGLVVAFIAMIVMFGFKAAFFRICKIKDHNEVGNDDYFFFFKKPYLGKTCKLGLMSMGLFVAAYILCFFPVIYMIVPVTMINIIYAFNPEISASDIVKLSFKLGNKKWLLTVGLLFVAGILAGVVGMLMCGIGVLATTAFGYIPVYFIYKHTIGFNEKSEIDKIGLVEF
ncbi:hypothetical protein MHTCC0001_21650 [Flavobacteriaceae bacterium MHTCC 0001]